MKKGISPLVCTAEDRHASRSKPKFALMTARQAYASGQWSTHSEANSREGQAVGALMEQGAPTPRGMAPKAPPVLFGERQVPALRPARAPTAPLPGTTRSCAVVRPPQVSA